MKSEYDKQVAEHSSKLQGQEQKLKQREQSLNSKVEELQRRSNELKNASENLNNQINVLHKRQDEVEKLHKKNPDQFNQNFLGVIDLTQHAVSKDGVVIGLLILAGVAAYLQYLTSKQLSPQSDSKRKLRDILAEAGGGKEADQSEVNAIMTRKNYEIGRASCRERV